MSKKDKLILEYFRVIRYRDSCNDWTDDYEEFHYKAKAIEEQIRDIIEEETTNERMQSKK